MHRSDRLGAVAHAHDVALAGWNVDHVFQGIAGLHTDHASPAAGPCNGEVDRVYVNTAATCIIEDRALKRRIIVDKAGS